MKQKRILIISFLLTCVLTTLFAKGDADLEKFNRELDQVGLSFILPPGFKPAAVLDNEDVLYQYAIKHVDKKFEIRYSIFSAKEYSQVRDIDHVAFTLAVIENIAGDSSNVLRSTQFDKNAVKSEFNAELGSSAIVIPDSDYGKGYKNAMIVSLFKTNAGSVYIVFLFDDINVIRDGFDQTFHSIKFKP